MWELIGPTCATLERCNSIYPLLPLNVKPVRAQSSDSMDISRLRLDSLRGPRLMRKLIDCFELKHDELPFNNLPRVSIPTHQQFSSYDYLSLRKHPEVLQAASFALQKHGLSTCASRVVAGELPDHTSLETKLASLYDKEAALTFVSGHATNVSTIAALVEKGDLIVADQLSHNSIQTGAKLSGARFLRFKHNDPGHLLHLLRRYRHDCHRCLIITEGHFSMDGDIPDLQALCSFRDQFNALLMVDEAHALGVLGSRGLGSHEHLNIDPKSVDIWMGTLSKSLGSTGGYIAASSVLINHLRLFAPGFTYSVGLNAPCCAAAEAALNLLLSDSSRTRILQQNSKLLHDQLADLNFNLGSSKGTAIIPVILDPQTTFRAANELLKSGWGVYPLGPPSVPSKGFRLRLFVRSDHSSDDLAGLTRVIYSAIS